LRENYIKIVKIKQIYKLLKRHNLLPDLTKKRTFKLADIPAIFMSKSNFKGLLFSGVILLTTAFFTPLKIYYIVLGSISLLLAIISLSPLGKDIPHQRQSLTDLISSLESRTHLSSIENNDEFVDGNERDDKKEKNDE
jgi:hypothetical protein